LMETKQTPRNRKGNFLVQGSILATAGILVRIIGLVYRIPLARILDNEGLGYYSQAFNVYSIILLLSSYSLPLAVSKMISARLAKKQYANAASILRVALIYATAVGAAGFILVWFFADALALFVFKMHPASYALRALAPTIWVMAYLGVFRGYYQGHSTMIPTAISQIVEQIVNAGVSIGAAKYLSEMAIKRSETLSTVHAYGAAGGTIGTGAGAAFALISLLILFILGAEFRNKKIKEDVLNKKESYLRITAILFYTVIPVIASTAIYNINSIIDSAIFGHSLSRFMEEKIIAGQYGIYTNKYLILINVPIAIANSLSSSLIPELSRAGADGNRAKVNSTIALATRFAMLVSMPAAVGLTILAEPIISLLFGFDATAITLLQVGSVAVVLYSLSTVSNAILQGTNNMSVPVKNAAVSLIIHTAILLLFLNVFRLDVYGLVFANILFAALMCFFNAMEIKLRLYYRQEIFRTYIMPFICSFIMGIIVFIIYALCDKLFGKNIINAVVPMFAALVSYPVLLILTRTLKKEELLLMPKGRKIVRILEMVRLV